MQNWMMMFTFSVFDRKYPSWANLAEKSKIVCSKWSLIQRLILIFRIQWWCFFICFRLEVPFLGYPIGTNFVQKIKIVSLSWKLVHRLIRIWRIQRWCSVFLFLIGSILFLKKNCSINQNSLLKLSLRT